MEPMHRGTQVNGLMQGKRGLIMGVANDHSIAWGIAKTLAEHGAELAFTYQGEALGKRVTPLAQSLGSNLVIPCDVEDIASVDAVFDTLDRQWENLDFVARMYRLDARRQRVDQALADLGLADRQKQLAGSLSGGWKQRLALASDMRNVAVALGGGTPVFDMPARLRLLETRRFDGSDNVLLRYAVDRATDGAVRR